MLDKPDAQQRLVRDLQIALRESVKLQAHYAKLLNQWYGGQRMIFGDAEAWIARLRETKTLPPLENPAKPKPDASADCSANRIVKLTNDEIGQIAVAVREALEAPEDKRSVEDIIRSVFAIQCYKCGYWIDRFVVPLSQQKEPFLCTECCSCGQ